MALQKALPRQPSSTNQNLAVGAGAKGVTSNLRPTSLVRYRIPVYIVIVLVCVGAPIAIEWATTPAPSLTERKIHIELFRYGASPSIIRANRGDPITLTFSTRDTGHSFFLQDYRVEAKVAPARETVKIVDPLRATESLHDARELRLTAGTPGGWGNLVSVSRFRCHIYCGPMHGFEQGDLIVRPNSLLWGSLGSLAAILLIGFLRVRWDTPREERGTEARREGEPPPDIDLTRRLPWLGSLLRWRPLQFMITMPVMAVFVLVILTGLFGTKVGGRNFAVMTTWAIWMTMMTTLLVPLSTRIWCLVCPLPLLGEFLQRGAMTQVRPATKPSRFGNRFFWLRRRWPRALRGTWVRLIFFVGLGTFSASLAGQPRWTAVLLLSLAAMGVLMSVVWELRAFCRYLCPAAAFISLYSAVGRLKVRNRDDAVCRSCKGKPCLRGNENGWACPFGLYVPQLTRNSECGVCTECFKSCPHDNISLSWRRGPWAERFSTHSEAWQAIVLLVLAIVYSLTVHSPWPAVRDMANVIDKATWFEFGLYAAGVSVLALGVVPLVFWLAVRWGQRMAVQGQRDIGLPAVIHVSSTGAPGNPGTGTVFQRTMPALIPSGLGMWAAFFIAIILTNFTFILYAFSDPFGWGWDLLGTAGMAWVQIWPSGIPWLQAAAVLVGTAFSLRQGYRLWFAETMNESAALRGFMPTGAILSALATGMLVYFTYF